MKILTDEDGKKYEMLHFESHFKGNNLLWARELPEEQKTFSWNDVADDVLVSWLGKNGSKNFMLSDDTKYAVHVGDHLGSLRFSNKWNLWWTGKCPLPEGVNIEASTRGCTICSSAATYLEWGHHPHYHPDQQIIAYRVTGLEDGYVYPDEVNNG